MAPQGQGSGEPVEAGVAPVRWIHGGPVAERLGLEVDAAPEPASPPARGRASGAASRRRSEADSADEVQVFAPIEEASLRALGRRGLSRRELARRLESAGYEAEAVELELDRLEQTGLVDGLGLAQRLVGELQDRKRLGRSAIAAELARRMLAPAAIEYALDLVDDGDELARARELAEKRIRSLSGLDPTTRDRRLSAYLARRGFSGSTIRAAVEAALPSA